MGVSHSTFKRTTNNKSQQQSYFPFHLLSDEITLEIISYISFAPYEIYYGDDDGNGGKGKSCNGYYPGLKSNVSPPHNHSTLTHVLPFVSKQFYSLCNEDSLWISSFQNLINNHPERWKHSLLSLIDVQVGKTVPPWSKFHNTNSIDCNDYMLAAKVKQLEVLNVVERKKLLLDIYNSGQRKMKKISSYQNKSNYHDQNYGYYECNHDHGHDYSNGYSYFLRRKTRDGDIDNSDYVSKCEAKEFYLTFIINFIQMSLPIINIQSSGLRKGISFDMTMLERRYCNLIIDTMNKNMKRKGNEKGKGKNTSSGTNELNFGSKHQFRFILTNQQSSLSKGSTAFLAEIKINANRPFQGDIGACRKNMKVHVIKKVQLIEIDKSLDSENGLHPRNAQIKKFH